MTTSTRRTFHYDDFVGSVDVQTPTVERERDGIVVQRAVGAGIVLGSMHMIRKSDSGRDFRTDHCDRCPSQPCDELLNVSNPKDLSEGGPEGGLVPETKIEATRTVSARHQTVSLTMFLRVIKPFPLFNSEEFAKLGIPKSNSLSILSVSRELSEFRRINAIPHTDTTSA